jgi:hypothetical protein
MREIHDGRGPRGYGGANGGHPARHGSPRDGSAAADVVGFTLAHLDHEVRSAPRIHEAIEIVHGWMRDLVIADYDRELAALQRTPARS